MSAVSRRALVTFGNHCRRMADSKPTDRLLLEPFTGETHETQVGQISDSDRALWRRLADEVEDYLHDDRAPGPDDAPLFATAASGKDTLP